MGFDLQARKFILSHERCFPLYKLDKVCWHTYIPETPWPSCSTLSMSLDKELLKFQAYCTQKHEFFLLKICEELLHSHIFFFFFSKNMSLPNCVGTRRLNKSLTDNFFKLGVLWTIRPRCFECLELSCSRHCLPKEVVNQWCMTLPLQWLWPSLILSTSFWHLFNKMIVS